MRIKPVICTALLLGAFLATCVSIAHAASDRASWNCYLTEPSAGEPQADGKQSYTIGCVRPAGADDTQYLPKPKGDRVVVLQSRVNDLSVTPDAIGAWNVKVQSPLGVVLAEYRGKKPSACSKLENTTDQRAIAKWRCNAD